MNYEDYLTAKAIILKSLKSSKLLTEYKAWDNLEYAARLEAIADSMCPLCKKIKELTGSWQHLFSTEWVCQDCSDENNPRLMKFREEFN